MQDDLERLHAYLSALDTAGHAVDEARTLFPDPDLDHAVERLRTLLLEGAEQLHRLKANQDGLTDRLSRSGC
jgi:hypothetical protein